MADLSSTERLDIIDINLLLGAALGLVRVAVVAVLVELETDALVGVGLVDLCVFG
jgi:hypothetical protein